MPQAAIGFIAAPLVGLLGEGAAIATATFLLNTAAVTALSAGINVAQRALSKNKQQVQQRQASVTSLSIGEVPREMVAGVCVTGGSMIDAFNHGGQYGTDFVSMCIALADHAVEALYGVIVDEVEHLFPGSGVQPGYSGLLQVHFANATEAGTAPPAHILSANAGWTETDRLAGISHVWVTYRFDEKVWTQGHPKLKFQMRGIRVYDPRRDPALGYVGPNPNTWEDRSTHLYDANAALVRYAFTRGIYAEGHQGDPNYLLIGRGLSAEEAPPQRVIAAANLCAEPVTDPDGQANIRYKVGGVIRASDDFIQVEEMFAAAMAGVIVQREGGVEVEPGHAKAAVATITDGDLIVGETVSFQAFLPDADGGRINTVVPRYVSPAQNWSDHAGPVRRDLADIAEDGGPRETTLPLVLVYEAGQADRCAEIARRMARLERRATLVLGPEYSWLEEGDWIAWKSDRHHGGATVRYRIESWSLDEQWRMRLSLREIASSVYGVPDPVDDTAEVPPAPVPVDALILPGAAAQAITLAGDASVIPAIRFTWDTPVDGAIRAIRGEVRILGDTDASPTRFEDIAAGVGIATNGVAAGQVLQARLVPIGDPTRPVLPSAWFTVTTGEILVGGLTPSGRDQLVIALRDQLSDTAAAERLAETLIQTILDEQESYEIEAERRLDADTGVLNEATSHTDNSVAEAMNLVYTRAQTDAGLASTLQVARSYTDTYKSEAELLFSTKTERANGDALAVIQAKAYTDDFESRASLTFATQAALGSGLASTLSSAQSYTNGQVSTALNTVYTRAQTDTAIATTLSSARAYTDTLRSDASAIYATSAALGGVSSTASLALSSAVAANGTANATFGLALNVSGYVSGFQSVNTGSFSTFYVLADAFGLFAPNGGARTEYQSGVWYAYPADNSTRSMWGKPFGGSYGLVWWTGPNSVPIGSETKANAYVYISTNTFGGARFGGSDVGGGTGPLQAFPSAEIAYGSSAPGGGFAGSSTITITPSGPGAGSATCRWTKVDGDAGIGINASGFSASFFGTVPPGGLARAFYLAVIYSGGQSVTVLIDVQLSDPN